MTPQNPVYRNSIFLGIFLLVSTFSYGQWAKSGSTRAVSIVTAQDINQGGDLISAGIFTCNTSFDSFTLENNACFEDSGSPIETGRLDLFVTRTDDQGNIIWARDIEGSNSNSAIVNKVLVDGSDNIYLGGEYLETLFTNPSTPLVNQDTVPDGFIIKLLPDGTPDWWVQVGGTDSSFIAINDMAIRNNELLVAGTLRGKLEIAADKDSLVDNTMFYASYNLDGTENWMKNFTPTNIGAESWAKGIATVGDSAYFLIEYSDDVELGTTSLAVAGGPSTALFSIDAVGDINSSHVLNTADIFDLGVTGTDSSIYLTGNSTGPVAIDATPVVIGAGAKAFLISLDFDGGIKWGLPITSNNTTDLSARAVSVGIDDAVLVGGNFTGTTITSDGNTTNGQGDLNGFVLLTDSLGTVTWIQSLGGSNEDGITVVNATDQNTLYASGYFSDYLRVGGNELLNEAASRNGFFSRLDICPEVIVDLLSMTETYVCEGEIVSLNVTDLPSYSYTWYKDGIEITGEILSQLDVSETATYYAEIDNGLGCIKNSPSAFIGINPAPLVSNSSADDLIKCAGDSVKLKGPPQIGTWQWFELGGGLLGGEDTNELIVKTNGDYFLRATSDSLCIAYSDTLKVEFFDYPDSTLNLNTKQVICGGETIDLQAETNPAFSYQWYKDGETINGANTDAFQVSETGIYWAVIQNSIGCESLTSSDTVVVQNAPVIVLNDASLPPLICTGQTVKIIADNVIGQNYQWYKDGTPITNATANSYEASGAGDYEVEVSNATCTNFSSTVSFTEDSPPPASISNGNSIIICQNDFTLLNANTGSGYTYRWFRNDQLLDGETGAELSVSEAGQYEVEVSNTSGCANISNATLLTVNPIPSANITAEDVVTCEGGSLTLSANTGNNYIYQWYKDSSPVQNATNQELVVSQTGLYQVEVTNTNNCSNLSDELEITVFQIPQSVISFTGSPVICEFDSLLLSGSVGNLYEYQWIRSGNEIEDATESDYYAKEPGDYELITFVGNCSDISSITTITVTAAPRPVITRNSDFLSIESFPSIQWYLDDTPLSGSVSQNIQAVEDGFYKVMVTNQNGCSAFSDSVSICLPIPEISRDQDILTASVPDRQYQWLFDGVIINGATSRQLTAQQSGIYSVIVTNDQNCSMESTPIQACIPYPEIEREISTGILKAIPEIAKAYQWYKDGILLQNETLNVFIPIEAGSYEVEITDFTDCQGISEPYVIDVISGLSDGTIRSISVYPNPVSNQLYIDTDRTSSVCITSLNGNILFDSEIQPGNPIDIEGFTSGYYLIQVINEEEVFHSRFFKKD